MVNERALEREFDCLEEQLEDGSISREECVKAENDLMRDAYEQDQQDALEAVDDHWGVSRQ